MSKKLEPDFEPLNEYDDGIDYSKFTDEELKAMGIEVPEMEDCSVIDSDLSLGLWLEELDRLSGGEPFNPMDGSEPRFRIKPKG